MPASQLAFLIRLWVTTFPYHPRDVEMCYDFNDQAVVGRLTGAKSYWQIKQIEWSKHNKSSGIDNDNTNEQTSDDNKISKGAWLLVDAN